MTFLEAGPILGGCDERLAALLDVEVVKEGIEVVLGGEACIEQEALDARGHSLRPR